MRFRHRTPFYQHRSPKKNVTLIFITEPNNAEHALKKKRTEQYRLPAKNKPNRTVKLSKMTYFSRNIEKKYDFPVFFNTGVLAKCHEYSIMSSFSSHIDKKFYLSIFHRRQSASKAMKWSATGALRHKLLTMYLKKISRNRKKIPEAP